MGFFRQLWNVLAYPFRLLLSAPGRVPQRLLRLSAPARVAILVAVFLLICVAAAYVVFFYTPNRTSWNYWVNPVRVSIIVALVVVIPLVVYKALALWLEGEASRFPDIDFAWKAGLAELRAHGLDLTEVPLFLILGTPDDAAEKALMDASRLSFRVHQVPQGPAALHWYANPDVIYLACTGVSSLGKIAQLAKAAMAEELGAPAPIAARPAPDDIRGTIVAGDARPAHTPIATSGMLPVRGATGPAPGTADIRGTMMVGGAMTGGGAADAGDFVAPPEKRPIALSQNDAAEQEQRLEYLCRLIRVARQTLCPINGILALLPYGLIQRGPREGIEVQRAAKRDLAALHRALKVRCPVTALVAGLESESGFRELVRRVGRERAAAQRFGKGFGLWNPPLAERVEAVCAHACGAFEDWVYNLFREKGALAKPGNTKLFALLCKIRRNVQARLANVLAAAFGRSPQETDKQPFLFGGCYFAGTGETEDRQAFIKGVFDKLPEQQEEVEWTAEALEEDRRYRGWANGVLAIDALLFVGLVAMIVYRWFWK
jgi:hypothetical protein